MAIIPNADLARNLQAQAAAASKPTPEPNVRRYNNGFRVYPVPADVCRLADPLPTGKGADQRRRLTEIQAAHKDLPKDQEFTAEYIAATCPGGRRTLRRAVRAGFLVWGDTPDNPQEDK